MPWGMWLRPAERSGEKAQRHSRVGLPAAAHQLKHLPPQRTLAELRLLQPKAKRDEQTAALDSAQHYLQRRLEMIDYPYFQRRGYPIGSGSVESAHKQVVQRRFKQAGMRWAPQNVDPCWPCVT